MRKLITRAIIIVTGSLTVLFFAALFDAITGNLALTRPGEQLANGQIVRVAGNSTFRIYLEETVLPSEHSRHEFVFTKIMTGEGINSHLRYEHLVSTYSRDDVYGRLAAAVDLTPGSYIIEFEPRDDNGIFVWGGNIFINIFINIFGPFGIFRRVTWIFFGGTGVISMAVCIYCTVPRFKGKKTVKGEGLHDGHNTTV